MSTSARATIATSPTGSGRPRRLHLLEEIRHARLSRRRPRLGARTAVAGRRRRGRAQGAGAGRVAPRRAGADRAAPDRPRRLGLEHVEDNPFWCPDPAAVRAGPIISTACARPAPRPARSSRLSQAASRRARRAGLRQARRRPRPRLYDDQCRQGGRDRRRLRRRWCSAARRTATRCGCGRQVEFLSNHAGGILGGISTGQDIVVASRSSRPARSCTPTRTVDSDGNEVEIETHGRHDPCVGIRAVPVGEAMIACVLADHLLLYRAIGGKV